MFDSFPTRPSVTYFYRVAYKRPDSEEFSWWTRPLATFEEAIVEFKKEWHSYSSGARQNNIVLIRVREDGVGGSEKLAWVPLND